MVVVIGEDRTLLESRALVLKSRDYDTTCGLASEAPQLLEMDPDLLLLCSSLSSETAAEIARTGKLHSAKLRIVRLDVDRALEAPMTNVDEVVQIDYHPMTWVNVIKRLLRSEDHPPTIP